MVLGFACDPGDDFDVLRTIYPACQACLLFNRSCSVFKNKKNRKTAILEKSECPLEGKCLQWNVVYQGTATTNTTTKSYVMLASNFKERYGNHKTSFRLNNRQNETKLSKHIWSLKDANKPFQIKWKIIRQWQPYSNIAKKCNLCLYEEFIIIICKKDLCSLKKCDKLGSSCLHRKRYILKNFKN